MAPPHCISLSGLGPVWIILSALCFPSKSFSQLYFHSHVITSLMSVFLHHWGLIHIRQKSPIFIHNVINTAVVQHHSSLATERFSHPKSSLKGQVSLFTLYLSPSSLHGPRGEFLPRLSVGWWEERKQAGGRVRQPLIRRRTRNCTEILACLISVFLTTTWWSDSVISILQMRRLSPRKPTHSRSSS